MHEALKDSVGFSRPSQRVDHPVFRGFTALDTKPAEIARMVGISSVTVTNWSDGRERFPAEWAIYLTKLLAGWVSALEQSSVNSGTPRANHANVALINSRNWLGLAQELVKDMPAEAFSAAMRLADKQLRHAA